MGLDISLLMNNHSIIRIITIFFIAIFFLINALFWIAQEYFSQDILSDRIHRFELAHRLLHHPNEDFNTELKQLFIASSELSFMLIQNNGKVLAESHFGKIMEYKQKVYFIESPPPPPPFMAGFLPPPKPLRKFNNLVLEDLKEESSLTLFSTFIFIDLLFLLFFGYIIKKLLPLLRLKNAIANFSKEDTFLNISISGQDEISQITQEFNSVLAKLASMRQARSLFLRNILHELKTPIMKGSLTTDCLEVSEHQERLKQIFERMNYLLGEFSKMERFNSGEWELNPREYRFVDLLDHTRDLLLCDKDSFVIQAEEKSLIVNVDFELFAIAIKNLLDNAFKYSSEKPIITVNADKIKICSAGDMLSDENRVFTKPFNRTYENSMSGLGLGLYITNAIIQKHGFKLKYEYVLGYNCFEIFL